MSNDEELEVAKSNSEVIISDYFTLAADFDVSNQNSKHISDDSGSVCANIHNLDIDISFDSRETNQCTDKSLDFKTGSTAFVCQTNTEGLNGLEQLGTSPSDPLVCKQETNTYTKSTNKTSISVCNHIKRCLIKPKRSKRLELKRSADPIQNVRFGRFYDRINNSSGEMSTKREKVKYNVSVQNKTVRKNQTSIYKSGEYSDGTCLEDRNKHFERTKNKLNLKLPIIPKSKSKNVKSLKTCEISFNSNILGKIKPCSVLVEPCSVKVEHIAKHMLIPGNSKINELGCVSDESLPSTTKQYLVNTSNSVKPLAINTSANKDHKPTAILSKQKPLSVLLNSKIRPPVINSTQMEPISKKIKFNEPICEINSKTKENTPTTSPLLLKPKSILADPEVRPPTVNSSHVEPVSTEIKSNESICEINCKTKDCALTANLLKPKRPPILQDSKVMDGSNPDFDSGGNVRCATKSSQIVPQEKESDLEELLDGVPPFIQEVLKCDNIRDGFVTEDLIFVLSLLPDMEEMSDNEKLQFQLRVIETITDVLSDPVLKSTK